MSAERLHPLKAWRRARGLSLSQAARRLGVVKSTVCKWESGKTIPHGEDMRRLLDHTGLGAGDFYPAPEPAGAS